jgi:hypothetical protein
LIDPASAWTSQKQLSSERNRLVTDETVRPDWPYCEVLYTRLNPRSRCQEPAEDVLIDGSKLRLVCPWHLDAQPGTAFAEEAAPPLEELPTSLLRLALDRLEAIEAAWTQQVGELMQRYEYHLGQARKAEEEARLARHKATDAGNAAESASRLLDQRDQESAEQATFRVLVKRRGEPRRAGERWSDYQARASSWEEFRDEDHPSGRFHSFSEARSLARVLVRSGKYEQARVVDQRMSVAWFVRRPGDRVVDSLAG